MSGVSHTHDRQQPRTPARRAAALLLALLLASATGSSVFAGVLRLKARAAVDGPMIRLSDIAEIALHDETFHEVVVKPAGPPGKDVAIGIDEIQSRLQSYGISLTTVEFTGASQCLVTTITEPAGARSDAAAQNTLAAARQRREVEARLATVVRERFEEARPDLQPVAVSVRLAEEHLTVAAALQPPYRLNGGTADWQAPQHLQIEGTTADGTRAAAPVVCTLTQLPRVIVASTTLARGDVITAADLRWEAGEPGDVPISPQELVGLEVTRTVRQNQRLRKDDVRRVPLVRSNDVISVYVRMPGLAVQRHMKARQSGAAGDVIECVSLDGQRRVYATVSGYHEATLGEQPATPTTSDGTGVIQFEDVAARRSEQY